jgi:hypothetical protein
MRHEFSWSHISERFSYTKAAFHILKQAGCPHWATGVITWGVSSSAASLHNELMIWLLISHTG